MSLGADALEALRSWRDEHVPQASSASVLMARTVAELQERLAVAPGAHVMMDARRYLPEPRRVHGNFATGPYLPVDAADPRALGRAVTDSASAGVPLVLLAALTTRNVVRPAGAAAPATAGEPPAARVTLSHQGRLDLSALPWRDRDAAAFVVAGRPSGPEGLTVCFVPTPAGLHVTAAFHPDVLDARAVAGALEALRDGVAGGPPAP